MEHNYWGGEQGEALVILSGAMEVMAVSVGSGGEIGA